MLTQTSPEAPALFRLLQAVFSHAASLAHYKHAYVQSCSAKAQAEQEWAWFVQWAATFYTNLGTGAALSAAARPRPPPHVLCVVLLSVGMQQAITCRSGAPRAMRLLLLPPLSSASSTALLFSDYTLPPPPHPLLPSHMPTISALISSMRFGGGWWCGGLGAVLRVCVK